MSLQTKSKNVRVLSAKITHGQTERIRPLSGLPNHTYTRRQMIETVYNSQGSQQNRIQSARQPTNNFISQNFENDRPIRKASKQAKQKEQMASQILGLKQTVNRLVEELSLQKGKCENMRKKSLKYSKILTMEFQDQKQWTSNSVNIHLVAGIKNMYDTLKEKYQAKCEEFDNFIKKVQITKNMENEQYVKTLQNQIKNLKKKIEKTNQLNLNSAFTNQTQRYANQYVIADLQNEKIVLTEKNKELEKKVKMMTQNFKEFQLKIQLDKKLITQKDNNLHAFQRKNKQLTKQCQKFKQLNLILDKQLQEMKQKYERQALAHQDFVTVSQIKCKNQVELISRSKDIKIQSLQQDNTYLHKMIQDLRSTNLQLNKANQQLREQNLKNSSKGQDDRYDSRDFKKQSNKTTSKSQNQSSMKLNSVFGQNGKRLPQKADKKYHENAVKTRKIQLVQVLQIAQLVRLKLIAQQISIEKVKRLFDYKQQSLSSQKDKQWQKEYITMLQVKQLFTKAPFCLDEQDSTIISRYLIEDVQEDYVYCDELNQNHREVIKSIIKTLIQEYPTYSDGSPQYYEMNDIIEKYGKNLRSAIKSITKETTISKARLGEAMKCIGMEVEQKIFQLILSKMAVKSKNLNTLDYSAII